ncbi:SusC/RagA family TonB-linked outer membrane protein [Dinghuibacter silviterrae]|uniref:TonB-linked SusC/RagA family outer membrane protein n=1 Tax=Dinghuibacter silviterrae TaxID=1539049 RepID=A0A4R8DTH6_9BACT|nr:TonB-dependent receptor [Dinghuibacter silviterrae]TDX01590.1 TonB-linked SusC/RagA family outer membrane protein [Dinghuibacter silviterrae]
MLPKLFAGRLLLPILLLFFTTTEAQQKARAVEQEVRGHVTSVTGTPLAGASVQVKGTNRGVVTDGSGNFVIRAKPNDILVITSVGYTPHEVDARSFLRSQTPLQVSLEVSNTSLDQVIVVGYGTQRKRDVTGSVVSVSGAALQEVPTANVISELKGRAAGVDIISNSATPGGGGQIRIRGNRSLATTQSASDGLDQPLLVVDGIPYGGSINDLNPDDIVSLDILKDASATAIYGSRGSGGVILVTTRRGRVGKAVTSVNTYFGVSSILGEYHVFDGKEYAQFKTDAGTYNRSAGGTGVNSYALTNAEQAGLAAGTSTDWQKLIYQKATTTSTQLNISGGTEGTQYGLNVGYYNENGIIPNQNFRRFALGTTLDHNMSSHLKIGIATMNSLQVANTPGGSGVPSGIMRFSPLTSPYNPDGSLNLHPLVGSIDAAFVNPLTLKTDAVAILARARTLRTFNSLYGEWAIMPGLKYRINVGLDYYQTQSDNYSGPNTFVQNNTSLAAASESVGNSQSWRYTIENLLTYDKTFAEKHRLTFTGLYSVQKDHTDASSFTGTGIPADYIQNTNLALANTVTAGTGTWAERGLISYMGRVNYAYDNRFLLTATVREDGASVLSQGHQYFVYPALAGGWNLTNEKFMAGTSRVLTNLKLRGGWGITSNQGVDPYSTLGALTTSTYNFGTTTAGQQGTYVVTNLANPNLHWESTAQTNIGVDFGFLKSRITGSIDVYHQATKDILLSETLPPSNGAGTTIANLGKTSGKGIEIALSTINIQARNFTWSTDVNFYLNREKVVQLTAPGVKQDIVDGWFVGQPLSVIYDLKKIGIWQTSDSISGKLAAQTSPVQYPGQIKVQDLNHDGKIDANDRQIIGNFQPKWEGGFTSRMTYKNIDFTFVIFARMGQMVEVPYITDDGGANGYPFFMQSRANQLKVNYWTRTNPTNDFPAPDASLQSIIWGSTLGYTDGSFIKMRSINLGYTFPSRVLGHIGISSLRVYATAENPFIIWAPFVKKGYGPDPEGNGYGGSVTTANAGGTTPSPSRQVSVNANNPSTRQFNVGLNLKF